MWRSDRCDRSGCGTSSGSHGEPATLAPQPRHVCGLCSRPAAASVPAERTRPGQPGRASFSLLDVTATDLSTPSGRRTIRVGSGMFTFVLAMGMAVTALGIDSVLPAFPDIRAALGLPADSTEVAGLVTFFLIGSSAGLLPAGVLADRYGRRSVMFGGLVLYV